MNNLIIRTEQLDGPMVTQETMQSLVDNISAMIQYQFNVIMQYVKEHTLTEDEMIAFLGSRTNDSKTHRLEGYFGPRTIHVPPQLLTNLQERKVLSYYCNINNYKITDWDWNLLNGKSPIKGPCLVFVVKFMEEILGFKTAPDDSFFIGLDGSPLKRAFRKKGPLVGFNNNFQPEDYYKAKNKSMYMRSLTVVQKIMGLHWLTMGDYAFREDLLDIKDDSKKLKKKRKERPPKKPRKVRKKKTYALTREGVVPGTGPIIGGDVPEIGPIPGGEGDNLVDKLEEIIEIPNEGVMNSIDREEFRRQPLFNQIQYLYEMVGGSLLGRSNQKLDPERRVSRAEFMAASLNQQTMWLYRQLQRMDDDADGETGHRRHLGIHYKAGARPGVITSLRKLSKGRVTQQTHYLGKRAMKHETKIQRAEKNIKSNNFRIQKIEKNVALIKKKLFLDKDQLKDNMDKLTDSIGKGAGALSKLNLINMIVGYAMDAVLLTIASTALGFAVDAKYRLDDHDKRFRKIYNFLTDDLLARFHFIWEEFAHVSEDISMVHLEIQRTDNKLKNLTMDTNTDRKLLVSVEQGLKDQAGKIGFLQENQDSLMEFRNRIEVLLTVVAQFFERNGISFTDKEGSLVDMSAIRQELEGAYNYLRELIDGQSLEIKAISRLASIRIDELERQLEIEREATQAARKVLETRINAQDALIQRLSDRLDAFDGPNGSVDLSAITEKVERLEQRVDNYDASIDSLHELTNDINFRLGSLNEYARRELQNQSQRIEMNGNDIRVLTERINEFNSSIAANREAIEEIRQSSTDFNGRLNTLDNTVSSLRSSLWDAVSKLNRLEQSSSQFENSIRLNRDSITFLNELSSKMSRICRTVKLQYIVKDWVPNQTTDGNGFMRLSMSSFPDDIISKTNDYIISIVPYDVYVSTYDRVFIAWCDYRTNNDNDREINLAIRYAYDSGIGRVGSGQRIKIWYWARSEAENMDL